LAVVVFVAVLVFFAVLVFVAVVVFFGAVAFLVADFFVALAGVGSSAGGGGSGVAAGGCGDRGAGGVGGAEVTGVGGVGGGSNLIAVSPSTRLWRRRPSTARPGGTSTSPIRTSVTGRGMTSQERLGRFARGPAKLAGPRRQCVRTRP
jgi:hypothetical protein